ncbi:MAG: LpxI family protein [Hyphomicrobiaceae bacterium]
MASAAARRIGILAGGGSLPREIADSVAARGLPVHVVALEGEADADFSPYPVTHVDWGQLGRMVEALKRNACTDLVIIGRVRRPDLGRIKPDLGFVRALGSVARILAAGGDDAVLRGVIRFFERAGLRVTSPADLAPELMVAAGPLVAPGLSEEALRDARLGFEAIAALSPYDIGQAVVVSGGRIEALEAAEGTDRMLTRVGDHRRRLGTIQGAVCGVLVKRAKTTQDRRIDLPAIGPHTVAGAIEAGLAGLAVEAGRVMVAARETTLERARLAKLAIDGIAITSPVVAAVPRAKRISGRLGRLVGRWRGEAPLLRKLGRHAPAPRIDRDARRAIEVLHALGERVDCTAVVVAHGHVLAVDCGEGALEVVKRAAGLRQWGDRRLRLRSGVVAIAGGRHILPDIVNAAADGGFAGIAVGLKRFAAGVGAESTATADARGVFIAAYPRSEDERHG